MGYADWYRSGAVVCEHIARDRSPILSAFRNEPIVPEDSGWQFFCGAANEENYTKAQIWALGEVFELDPSLEQFAELPPGMQVRRDTPNHQWQTARSESES